MLENILQRKVEKHFEREIINQWLCAVQIKLNADTKQQNYRKNIDTSIVMNDQFLICRRMLLGCSYFNLICYSV